MTDRDLTLNLCNLISPVWAFAHESQTIDGWTRRWSRMENRLWAYSEAIAMFGEPGTYSAMREDLVLLGQIALQHYDDGITQGGHPY